jgi:hypothetical protein
MGFFWNFLAQIETLCARGQSSKKMVKLFSLLAQHMWNSFLIKAIGKNISLMVHFGPIILVPNCIFEIMKNISHACVSLMKENRDVGWNRQTQCFISPISLGCCFLLSQIESP